MVRITKDAVSMVGIQAALVVSAVIFFYFPQSRTLNQLRTDIATQKLAIEADAEKARAVPQMLRQIQEMKKRYNDRWDKKLPKQKELGAFLREISESLERENLAGGFIQPGNPKREELFYTLPITMRFQGRFTAFNNFLESLDRMERLARIQKVNIMADTKQVPAMLDVQLRINIYFTDTESMPI